MEANGIMDQWYEAAKTRVSVRKYDSTPEKAVLTDLKDFARTLSNDDSRIVVGVCNGIFDKLLGTVIHGTSAYAALIQKTENEFMSGYIGEAFVLECTKRGLGTCWLGASYNKSKANSVVKLGGHEKLVCLIAFGIAADAESKPRSRKSLLRLTGMEDASIDMLSKWQQCALRCARIAPSALNSQPWEFDVVGDSFQVISTSNNFGYGAVDCGIAMLHVELGAAHCGLCGDWQFKNGIPTFTVQSPNNSI